MTAETPRSESVTNASDIVQQIIDKQCDVEYNVVCVKLDVLRILETLDEKNQYEILPGVTIHKRNSTAQPLRLPPELVATLSAQGSLDTTRSLEDLDDYLVAKVDRYLDAFSISLDYLDSKPVATLKQFGEDIFRRLMKASKLARRKGNNNLAWWAAGTMAAMGASSLIMLTGKALMLSILSLILSAGSAWRQFGLGGIGGRLTNCGGALIDVNGRHDVLGGRKNLMDEDQILNAYRAQVKVPPDIDDEEKMRLLAILTDLLAPPRKWARPQYLPIKRDPATDYYYLN
ncbi:uncharacterized protein [Bemisia tabaci]|uniref:uncharacterized protein isoform X2 n=1 Tax=Bemisia tabaci TaxID=7038 RepID=UPI003B27DF35